MNSDTLLAIAAFGGVSSLVGLAYLVFVPHSREIDVRLADASRPTPIRESALGWGCWRPCPGWGAKVMPMRRGKVENAETRLDAGGILSAVFLRHVLCLAVLACSLCQFFVGLALAAADMLPWLDGIEYGFGVGIIGTLLPGYVIKKIRMARQRQIRRALPDTLDVLVICLEGGLSLPASFARVTEELDAAFPLLAQEMSIVRKQIELGHSTADAFREFSQRFDVDELKSLALLLAQSEKFGASLVRTLRIQADSLRLKRYRWAEGEAQKAPLKLIFPTVLCIFPALYIVLMGPAIVARYLRVFRHGFYNLEVKRKEPAMKSQPIERSKLSVRPAKRCTFSISRVPRRARAPRSRNLP